MTVIRFITKTAVAAAAAGVLAAGMAAPALAAHSGPDAARPSAQPLDAEGVESLDLCVGGTVSLNLFGPPHCAMADPHQSGVDIDADLGGVDIDADLCGLDLRLVLDLARDDVVDLDLSCSQDN
ncbi:hypothetical protein [Glycomyces rhizosphaerae]|uniref:DUF320 domain-containing protein n=1 Tax=Glycomyces rhizosphaerae TaxID=2054422 RepID=A0ABV7Q1L3_9ACTN